MTYRINWIHPRDINNNWKHWRKFISPAIDKTDFFTVKDVKMLLRQGNARLFEITGLPEITLMVLKKTNYLSKNVMEVFLYVGSLGDEEYKQLLIDRLEVEALQENCSEIVMSGRKGWKKVMKRLRPDMIENTLLRIKL